MASVEPFIDEAAVVGAAVLVDESLLHEMAPIPTAPASASATNLLDRMNMFLSVGGSGTADRCACDYETTTVPVMEVWSWQK